MIVAIDPGPAHSGAVVWDGKCVLTARREAPIEELLEVLRGYRSYEPLIAIERVQSYGIAGSDYLRTAEVVGRLWQRALDLGLAVRLLYRREVLAVLDVAGPGGRDALVRQRLIERFGGARASAIGTRRAPGPLYGLAGHAWAALAVALAAEQRAGLEAAR